MTQCKNREFSEFELQLTDQQIAAKSISRDSPPLMATDEAEAFYNSVYSVVRLIPKGQVTTYGNLNPSLLQPIPHPSRSCLICFLAGHIAKLINHPRNSRQVGQALKYLQDDSVPWQRVVNHKGVISPRDVPGAVCRQRIRLIQEGVAVEDEVAGMDERFEGVGGGGR